MNVYILTAPSITSESAKAKVKCVIVY